MFAEKEYKKACFQSKIELLLSFVKRLAYFSYTFYHTRASYPLNGYSFGIKCLWFEVVLIRYPIWMDVQSNRALWFTYKQVQRVRSTRSDSFIHSTIPNLSYLIWALSKYNTPEQISRGIFRNLYYLSAHTFFTSH